MTARAIAPAVRERNAEDLNACPCAASQSVGACLCLKTTQEKRTLSHVERIEIPLLLK